MLNREIECNKKLSDVAPTEESETSWQEFYDDLSGERLNGQMVKEARKEEMEEVRT